MTYGYHVLELVGIGLWLAICIGKLDPEPYSTARVMMQVC